MRYLTILAKRPAGGFLSDGVTPAPELPVNQAIPLSQLINLSLAPQFEPGKPNIIVAQAIMAYVAGGAAVVVRRNLAVADPAQRTAIEAAYADLRTQLRDDAVQNIEVAYLET